MRFYTDQHRYYCGIDLHARSMYVCVLDQEGQTTFRNAWHHSQKVQNYQTSAASVANPLHGHVLHVPISNVNRRLNTLVRLWRHYVRFQGLRYRKYSRNSSRRTNAANGTVIGHAIPKMNAIFKFSEM